MATPIKIKRSAVPGKRPQVSDLQVGELALNTYDAELVTLRQEVLPIILSRQQIIQLLKLEVVLVHGHLVQHLIRHQLVF